MDRLSFIGVIVGFAALLGGNFLEGGTWQSLANGSAALIVFGGTIGAAILQTPRWSLLRALAIFKWIFFPPRREFAQGIDKVVGWALTARKEGLLGLENVAEAEVDAFSQKGLQLLADGSEPDLIRQIMETDLLVNEQRDQDAVHFYESMGGYAPTIGIIGAVMGLIHVMRHLGDPAELGPGIAVAFVATIYGVAFANLFLLPIASKLRLCIKEHSQYREMQIEGILAIADGRNPKAIKMQLSGYLH